MKRYCALLFAVGILLSGCSLIQPSLSEQYNATYFDLFDTVTTIVGSGETEEQFRQNAQKIYEELLAYHQLFDIYHEYEGIHNLKTVNDQAGVSPVAVDREIIQLLLDCKEYYTMTGGKVNAAMGSVLSLWRETRELSIQNPSAAQIPDAAALSLAAEHIDFDSVVIDEAASTVYITDPQTSLDVGAIAKGWAVQQVAAAAPEGMLISVGGNVCATGPKYSDGTPWIVGIQDPDNSEKYLHTISITGGAVVTSGDYQRVYTVGGKNYHHIIDPENQMPSAYWHSVTVVCSASGLADTLSTALFLLPLDEGQSLAEKCGAEAFWLDGDGNQFMTSGFRDVLQE